MDDEGEGVWSSLVLAAVEHIENDFQTGSDQFGRPGLHFVENEWGADMLCTPGFAYAVAERFAFEIGIPLVEYWHARGLDVTDLLNACVRSLQMETEEDRAEFVAKLPQGLRMERSRISGVIFKRF